MNRFTYLKGYYQVHQTELKAARNERYEASKIQSANLKVEQLVDFSHLKSQSSPPLGANYYNCQKPQCRGCFYRGIHASEYAYCSAEKYGDPTFQTYFDQCLVKHGEKHNQSNRLKPSKADGSGK